MKDKQCRYTMHKFVKYTTQTLGYLTTASKWRRCKEMSLNKENCRTQNVTDLPPSESVHDHDAWCEFGIQGSASSSAKFFKSYSVQSGSLQQEPLTFHSTHHVGRQRDCTTYTGWCRRKGQYFAKLLCRSLLLGWKYLNLKFKKALWMVTQKEKLLTVNLILSLFQCLHDKFVTAHSFRKSHRQPQFNLQIDVCVTVHHWYNNINSQLDATIIILLLIISISSTYFGR
jgi:hypothetical protein